MEKKKRGINFTSTEISLLMQTLKPELVIIENKKTDGATLRDKNSAWKRVTAAFNSLNNEVYRDMNSLKIKYENIKKTLKKKITSQKQNYTGTGGGPHVDIKLLWYEEILYSILQLGVDGLPSVGDSDISYESPADHTYTSDIRDEELSNIYLSDNHQNKEACSNEIELVFDDNPESDVMQSTSGIYTADNNEEIPSVEVPARTPLSSNRWNLKKRKRSTVTADQKKKSIDTFQKLTENKITLTETQEECYKLELRMKKEEANQKNEEWEIKKKILEVQLKLKQEEYGEILEERQRKKKLFELVQEEQKLKIDLLKYDLNAKLTQNISLGFHK